MITEEKIEKLLEDLRTGKYDTDRYTIDVESIYNMTITDHQNKIGIKLRIALTASMEQGKAYRKWLSGSKLYKLIHSKPSIEYDMPRCSASYYNLPLNLHNQKELIEDYIDISGDLYQSLEAYMRERQEQDKLILKSQVQSSFGL